VTDSRWLVAGLGNPPAEYAGTRHNVGAECLELLAERAGTSLTRNRRAGCRTAEVRLAGRAAVLAIPEGYMNTSGAPIQRALGWYRVAHAQLVIVHDDLDLPLGSLRVKRGGGHAGHNGLKDVDRALGTPDYLRVRIGVGRPPGGRDAADHVLRRFGAEEQATIATVLLDAADAVTSLVTDGLETTQNRYHVRPAGGREEDR
jgi:peptidyl-tRNA hydrolase, PTH1 family